MEKSPYEQGQKDKLETKVLQNAWTTGRTLPV